MKNDSPSYDIDIVTLGCSKNLVDSEVVMQHLEDMGYSCRHDAAEPRGRIAVINTCGFIADAKEESINTILAFAQAKDEGRLERLYVMGCLSQRYREELESEIPTVDRYFGKFDFAALYEEILQAGYRTDTNGRPQRCDSASAIEQATTRTRPYIAERKQGRQSQGYAPTLLSGRGVPLCLSVDKVKDAAIHHLRHVTTGHYAYIKISEGCDRRCAYCAIPLMTGRQVSRLPEDILAEVRALATAGIREFQVIAQELTSYGTDIDGRQHIAELISAMADIEGVEWIRLHYAYPAGFPYDLLRVMRERSNVCKYLDIALQHVSDNILQRMHRGITRAATIALIDRIRREVPGITLRTTLMVGFPGETEADFEELMAFTRTVRFERMGAFAYSEEEGTYGAEHYEDDVAEDVKQERLGRLMTLQQDISAEQQAAMIGRTVKVMIDRREGDYYVGRTEASSPEVDPEVLMKINDTTTDRLIGTFHNVRITDAEEFDLYGEIIE